LNCPSDIVAGEMGNKTNNDMVNDGFSPLPTTENLATSIQPESFYMRTTLPRQLFTCICLSIFGWYAPTNLIRPVTGMTMKTIPYQVLSSGDVILDQSLNYSAIDSENATIPSIILVHTNVTFPLFLLATIAILRPRVQPKYHDVHAGLCVIFLCIFMVQFSSSIVKMYVGRLRPNFYGLCDFNTTTLKCTADESHILEARSSFPSGHSSLSFGGMGCLVWFFLGRSGIGKVSSKCNYGEEKGAKRPFYERTWTDNKLGIIATFLPWMYASFVACSRLVDNWHHPSDILAGSLIGIFCSTLAYHLWYPHVFSPNAGIPLSWLIQNSGVEYEDIQN